MKRPTIAEAYTAKLAAFQRHTPFGVVLDEDRRALLRSVARDAGVTIRDAYVGILDHLRTGVPA